MKENGTISEPKELIWRKDQKRETWTNLTTLNTFKRRSRISDIGKKSPRAPGKTS